MGLTLLGYLTYILMVMAAITGIVLILLVWSYGLLAFIEGYNENTSGGSV